MRKDEFKSPAEMYKRDHLGRPCLFVCESQAGHKTLGLSWAAACEMAERLSTEMLEAA